LCITASHCISIHQAALWFVVPLQPLSSRFVADSGNFYVCVCAQNLRMRTLKPVAAAGKPGYKWKNTDDCNLPLRDIFKFSILR
jgi:hypothetical protein